jgi:transposase
MVADGAPQSNQLGRPGKACLCMVVNALLYMASAGMPVGGGDSERIPAGLDGPRLFFRWSRGETWLKINHALVMPARERTGREASPTAGVIDSQSVNTMESGSPHGFGAGKKIKGRKRHIVTGTEGHLAGLRVHPANIQDYAGNKLKEALARLGQRTSRSSGDATPQRASCCCRADGGRTHPRLA